MYYLRSNKAGVNFDYELLIELPNATQDYYCLLSDAEFSFENTDEISDFINYASELKVTVNPVYNESVDILMLLKNAESCILKKEVNGISADYFSGTIANKEGIEFDNESREISFSISSDLNILKTTKVANVNLGGAIQTHWYNIIHILTAYFMLSDITLIIPLPLNSINCFVRHPNTGVRIARYFHEFYYRFDSLLVHKPDITVWEWLKGQLNLFALDIFVIGNKAYLRNKFLSKVETVYTLNKGLDFGTTMSVKKGRSIVKCSYIYDWEYFYSGNYPVNPASEDIQNVDLSNVLDSRASNTIVNSYFGVYDYSQTTIINVMHRNVNSFDVYGNEDLSDKGYHYLSHILEDRIIVRTQMFFDSDFNIDDVWKFYEINIAGRNLKYKILNWNHNIGNNNSDIGLLEIKTITNRQNWGEWF